MSRQEFLQELQETLEGEISPSAVRDNLRYYENYFREQNALGRDDDAVLAELGDARLIARTILQSVEAGVDASPEGYDSDPTDHGGKDGGYRHDYTNTGTNGGTQNREEGNSSRYGETTRENGPEIHYIDTSKWYVRFGIAAAFVLILVLLFALMGGIFALLIRYAGPILLFVLLYSLIRRM